MCCIVRKQDFCLCENKAADQLRSNCEADQHLSVHYMDGTLPLLPKVCFVVCDNGFSQIFYDCSNVEEIFSWHNIASSLSQNVQQKF